MAAYGPNPTISERLVDERALELRNVDPYLVSRMSARPVDMRYDISPTPRFLGTPRAALTVEQVLSIGYLGLSPVDDAGYTGSHRNSLSLGMY